MAGLGTPTEVEETSRPDAAGDADGLDSSEGRRSREASRWCPHRRWRSSCDDSRNETELMDVAGSRGRDPRDDGGGDVAVEHGPAEQGQLCPA